MEFAFHLQLSSAYFFYNEMANFTFFVNIFKKNAFFLVSFPLPFWLIWLQDNFRNREHWDQITRKYYYFFRTICNCNVELLLLLLCFASTINKFVIFYLIIDEIELSSRWIKIYVNVISFYEVEQISKQRFQTQTT